MQDTKPPVSIEWWIYLAVLAGLIILTLILHVMVKRSATNNTPGKKYGVATLIVGIDNRTSTSKLQAFLWTYAVLWALVSLLAGAGVEDFFEVLNEDPREEYLLLLGGPFAAAIAAKAITTSRDSQQSKTERADNTDLAVTTRVSSRVVEVVANDEGGIDLGDFQYAAFTLVALTYFVFAFIQTPADGLPPIPATLLVLTGVSLSAYVAKKGLKTEYTADHANGKDTTADETKASADA